MKIHETRTITSEVEGGSEKTLLVHVRTQFDENIHFISLEVEGEPNLLRVNWRHPFRVHRKMVDHIESIINENPWILERLWFEATEPTRARLNARAFKLKGYQVYYEFGNYYSIRKP